MTKIGNKKLTHKIVFNRGISKRTSIGRSSNTRPKHKDTKRSHKAYRGQGFP